MSSNLLAELKTFWQDVIQYGESPPKNIDNFLEKLTLLKFAQNSRIYFSIFNYIDFKKEYCTRNTLEVFGFQHETDLEKSTQLLLSSIDDEHAKGILVNSLQIKELVENIKNEKDILNFMFSYCGLKYNHSQKGRIQLLWKNTVFETNELNQPMRCLSTFQDISNLMKGDFYWFRGVYKSSKRTYYMTYRSDTNETSKNDILSTREKEILKYLLDGKETDEIAKALFISKITINNHRQNMLNKLGAKDTTALIQLAKLTKLI